MDFYARRFPDRFENAYPFKCAGLPSPKRVHFIQQQRVPIAAAQIFEMAAQKNG